MYDEIEKMLLEVQSTPTSNRKKSYTSPSTQSVRTVTEKFPKIQSVTSYAPIFKNFSLSASDRIGTVKDNKVEVLEKYSETVYRVRYGNITGYMAKLWFND